MTGLSTPCGPQIDTEGTPDWIATPPMANGQRTEVVDYLPIYCSSVRTTFSFSDNVEIGDRPALVDSGEYVL